MAAATGAIVGGAIAAGGALGAAKMGSDAASAGADKAAALQQQAAQFFGQITPPTPAQMSIYLKHLVSVGQLAPEQETALQEADTAYRDIKTDPGNMQAQKDALAALQKVGSEGGMTAVDKAQLNDINNSTNANNKANQNAILQHAEATGTSGSGTSLASQLLSQQSGAQAASNQGFSAAASAQQRALAAIEAGGTLGGQMENQQFGEQAQTAAAQDKINQFNTANAQNVANTNVQTNNAAQQTNLANEQNIANTNTGLDNQQEMYNKGLQETDYQNQMQKASGLAGQYNNQAATANAAGQSEAAMWGGIGNAAAKAGGAIANYSLTPTKKTNPDGSTTI